MQTACPFCGKRYDVADAAVGKRARCGGCKWVFVVKPAEAASDAQPAQPAHRPQPVAEDVVQASPLTDEDAFGLPPLDSSSPLDDLLAAEMPATSPLSPAPVLPPVRRRRRRDWKKPVIFASVGVGAAVLVIGLIVGLVSLISSGVGGSALAKGGPMDWAGWAVPSDAQAVAYINVEKFRKSDLFPLVDKSVKAAGTLGNMPAAPLPTDKWDMVTSSFTESFHVTTGSKKEITVFRTPEDVDLQQMADLLKDIRVLGAGFPAPEAGSSEPRTHAGVQYLAVSDGFVAKTGSRTYCMADTEEDLHAALERCQGTQTASLSDQLRLAMESARGDHFFAMVLPDGVGPGNPFSSFPGRMPFAPPEWFGIGFSVDSSLRIDGAVGFPSEDDTAKIKREFDEAVEMMEDQLDQVPSSAPREVRDAANKLADMIGAVRLSRSGKTLRVTAKWRIKDLEYLVNQGQKFGGRSPFG